MIPKKIQKPALHHKLTNLSWYAVGFEGSDGEPFMIAAKTPRRARILAKYHIYDTSDITVEAVSIWWRSANPTNKNKK
jgi:hypothetical protein